MIFRICIQEVNSITFFMYKIYLVRKQTWNTIHLKLKQNGKVFGSKTRVLSPVKITAKIKNIS